MEFWDFGTIILGAVAAIIGFVIKWLLEKYANPYIKLALSTLNQVVVEAVYAVNQVYVVERKKANADGKLTEEEIKNAADMAWAYIKVQIPKILWNALKQLFGGEEGVRAAIEPKIEAIIDERKEGSL